MTEENFAEKLREKTKAAQDKGSIKTWWQEFAPRLIKASENGFSTLDVTDNLSPQQIDFCREKGLTVSKSARHKHPELAALPWYQISWGDK